MFIDTAKEVGSPVYIKHGPFAFFALSSIEISPHLYPLCLQDATVSSPLPPLLAAHFIHAMVPKLCDNCVHSSRETFLGYADFIYFDPAWIGDPLRGESLYIFDCMMGSVGKELTYEIYAFVV